MDKGNEKVVQIGIKVSKRLRLKLKWLALRRGTSISEITREYWERLVEREPDDGEADE